MLHKITFKYCQIDNKKVKLERKKYFFIVENVNAINLLFAKGVLRLFHYAVEALKFAKKTFQTVDRNEKMNKIRRMEKCSFRDTHNTEKEKQRTRELRDKKRMFESTLN